MAAYDTPPSASAKGKPSGRRYINLSMTVPAFLSSILALIVGLVWIFILGVIMGRGYTPESRIPELGKLMPKAGAYTAPTSLHENTQSNATDPKAAVAAKDPALNTDDLAYRQSLKNALPATIRPQNATQPAPADTKTPEKKAEPAVKEETFTYLYRVASYKSAQPAEAMVAKLKAAGLKPQLQKTTEKNITWYKVIVTFKGTPKETRTLRASLEKQKITRIILESKTPIK